ncbi:uncharacterized protein LOC126798338 [Argentina anserina]|uniref:uncharacterized protein LOC126798338 n=1 Tax=Argentina anserina TaxID=57926 RepID=UPI0021764736|nr:uncharacterized protein LOC126798338 [Potentilla anserina]
MTLLVILIVPLLSFLFLTSAAYCKLLNHPTMMSFCRKITPHSLLGPTATTTAAPLTANENLHHYIPSLTGGLLGLVTATTNDVGQHLVLESSSVEKQSSMPPLPSFLPPPATKVVSVGGGDIGGFGFLDEVGGGKDGFVSCTESLGFESSDEIMRVDDQVELDDEEVELSLMRLFEIKRSQWGRMRDKRSVDKDNNKFPPPISSLNKNGHPNFYLRSVRKDGRLEITEVRIHRPEILRAHREDGRLRLHFIGHEEDTIEEEQEEEFEDEGVDVEDINNVEEGKENVETESCVHDGDHWMMGVAGGEGFRRCQDVAGSSHHVHHHHHHHHNNHHMWSQQHCVM